MGETKQQERVLYSLFQKVSTNSNKRVSHTLCECETFSSSPPLKKTRNDERVSLEQMGTELKKTTLPNSSTTIRANPNETGSSSGHITDVPFRPDIDQENLPVSSSQKVYPLFELQSTEFGEGQLSEKRSVANAERGVRRTRNVIFESFKTCPDPQELILEKLSDSTQKTNGNLNKVAAQASKVDARQKRTLQLNPVTGLTGSPPTKKLANPAENLGNRTRKRQGKSHHTRIIKIKYNIALGLRLDQILTSQASMNKNSTPLIQEPLNTTPKINSIGGNILHPFFDTKYYKNSASITAIPTLGTENLKIVKIFPGKTQISAEKYNSDPQINGSYLNSPKISSSFSRNRNKAKAEKLQGAIESAWPCKGTLHVRGYEQAERLNAPDLKRSFFSPSQEKRAKGICVNVPHDENIFTAISNDVSIPKIAQNIKKIDPNELLWIPSCLRIPAKHSEYGVDVQHRLQKQLHARISDLNLQHEISSEDEINISICQANVPAHPAVVKAFTSIATQFSAFDKGECESQSWTQKYSPKNTDEVLQSGEEALILKEWLFSLVVNSVNVSNSTTKHPSSTRPDSVVKRKRRSAKFDNFVIPSDEDKMDDLEEIVESEDGAPSVGQNTSKPTLVRGGKSWKKQKDGSKIHRTILLSGPHGCGKSAAVYAAAKELGFEVFEINSSSKRSGKEIMERIGDMTQNHHVRNVAETNLNNSLDEDKIKLDAAIAKDIEIGRQGTMQSFLKPVLSKKYSMLSAEKALFSSPECKTSYKSCAEARKLKPSSKPAKVQKQSLILIEEAEIIFKEDGQFWQTIENLMAISRRPIVITCNDESAIPLANKSLYAILRFKPPPTDLAVDYMLTVAACEGHIIKREAVKALYEERQFDLRASLSELNFWCQFAVGDINRGLSWYCPRHKCSQVDATPSNTLRIISEGTYEKGMGWISQDIIESDLPHLDIEEEILRETSEFWSLDIGDWEDSIYFHKWVAKTQNLNDTGERRRAFLDMFTDFTDSMSASDLISKNLFGAGNQTSLDPSIPKMCNKQHDDYPVAFKVIEALPTVNYSNLSRSISFYLRSRIRNHLQVTQHLKHYIEIQPELSSPSESRIIDLIRQKRTACSPQLQRIDFSRAFDPISFPKMQNPWSPGGFTEASQFDYSLWIISEELAPCVRGIVAYDSRLQREREKKSNLLSEGGTSGKRRRTTRAAMSALEGGKRSETRRERYFGKELNSLLVLKTGLPSWTDAALHWQEKGENSACAKLQGHITTHARVISHDFDDVI